LIGLGDYGVAQGGADNSAGAGSGGIAGTTVVDGGSAGETVADGGTGGVPDDNTGSAGESGASGAAGSSGAPSSCTGSCDDSNDCTTDSCASGACAQDAVAVGTACGVARLCDGQALCVRCLDTAAGTALDSGCTAAAPVCLGTGLDATCGGCTTAADCSDGNECTSEACNSGKCVFSTVAVGTACATGVCNGTAAAEKCVACANTATGAAQDAGCTAAKPLCDPSGTATCYECLSGADCATDNVSCTVETCTNHQCSHVATDSLCPTSNDVCLPNKCDASVPGGCKQVDISTTKMIIGTGSTQGNGGFEDGTSSGAVGWANIGTYLTIYNCGPSTIGCSGANGKTTTSTTGGDFLAWLGGPPMVGVSGVDHVIALPLGTVKLQVIADINFQTKSAASSNKDLFEVRLLNSAKAQVGSALYKASNVDAQTGSSRSWTSNGINVTVDVSAYASAHPGEDSYISFWSSVDGSVVTDFFLDNVRVNATVCQ